MHDSATQLAALDALERNATSNGGRPVFSKVAEVVGVSRQTLQRWWATRDDVRARASGGSGGEPERVTQEQAEA